MRKSRSSVFLAVIASLAVAALACNAPTGPNTTDETVTAAAQTAAALVNVPSATVAIEGTADLTQAAQIPPTSDVPTNTAAPQQCQVTANTAVNIRTGPSTFHPILGILQNGVNAPVTGRNNDTSWWQINGNSWVSAPFVTTSGNCNSVPVAAFPPAPPTFTPTATATNTPTATFTATFTETPTDTLVPAALLDYNVSYVGPVWTCGTDKYGSFKVDNIGTEKLRSAEYWAEGPLNILLKHAIDNTPFQASATQPSPACANAGASSLNAGDSAYIYVNLGAAGVPGGTAGRLKLHLCTEDDAGGSCPEKFFTYNW
jgi:hypothetical protein